jgi:hypothetical protein
MQLNGLGTRAYALGLVWPPIFLEKKKVDGMSPAMVDNMSLVMVDKMSSSNSDFDHYYSGCKIEGIVFLPKKLVFQPTSPQKHT